MIGTIFCIIANIRFLKSGKSKIAAAVLGILFVGLIGGILVLVSQMD